MQVKFFIVTADLVGAFPAKQVLFLAYLANLYKMLKKSGKLTPDGYFYACVEQAAQISAAQATTQQTVLDTLKKRGLVKVYYGEANNKRFIKFTEKMMAEFPLLFGLTSTENNDVKNQKTGSTSVENGDAHQRKTVLNNNNQEKKPKKGKELQSNSLPGAGVFSEKILGKAEYKPISKGKEEISQKSCGKKGFLEQHQEIWDIYVDFVAQSGRIAPRLSEKSQLACISLFEQIEAQLSTNCQGAAISPEQVSAAWKHCLALVQKGAKMDLSKIDFLQPEKAKEAKNACAQCDFYFNKGKSIQLLNDYYQDLRAYAIKINQLTSKTATRTKELKNQLSSSPKPAQQQPKTSSTTAAAQNQLNHSSSRTAAAQPQQPKTSLTAAQPQQRNNSSADNAADLIANLAKKIQNGKYQSNDAQKQAIYQLLQPYTDGQIADANIAYLDTQVQEEKARTQRIFKNIGNCPKTRAIYLVQSILKSTK